MAIAVLWTIAIFLTIFAVKDYSGNAKVQSHIKNEPKVLKAVEETAPTQPTAPKDDFICPGDYEDPKQYAEDLVNSMMPYEDLPEEEQMQKRVATLIAHNCEWALLNIHLNAVLDNTIKFNGKEFGPYTLRVDDDTKVRSVYYPLKGQVAGMADEEIFYSFFIQGIWTDKPFTAEEVAMLLSDNSGEESNEVITKYEAPDPLTGERAFYIITIVNSENDNIYMLVSKVTSVGIDVYSVTYLKKMTEKEKNETVASWLEKNLDKYSKFFELKLPSQSLEKAFDQERETHALINQKTS